MLLAGRLFISGILGVLVVAQSYGAVCQSINGHRFSTTEEAVAKYRHLIKDCGAQSSEAPLSAEDARVPIASGSQSQGHADSVANTVHASDQSLRFFRQIQAVSSTFNIDPLLLHAIAHVESRHNPQAVSPAGAIGLMQVMPATARRFGLENPEYQLFDPMENLVVSSRYLRTLYGYFGNDLPLVLAAYNAGENAVIRHGRKVPPYRETREYVRKVMAYYLQLRHS